MAALSFFLTYLFCSCAICLQAQDDAIEVYMGVETVRRDLSKSPLKFKIAIFCLNPPNERYVMRAENGKTTNDLFDRSLLTVSTWECLHFCLVSFSRLLICTNDAKVWIGFDLGICQRPK